MKKLCQICKKEVRWLVMIKNQPFFLCAEHTKKLESHFGEIEPLTTTFQQIITYPLWI